MTAPPDATFPAQRFARALMSGEVSFALLHRLRAEFATIGREEVFVGCTLALSEMHASLIAADYEARVLRTQLERREAA
jgi:hypothetical protein